MPTSDAWLETDSDAWISLSARLQRLVAARSGRTDVVVRIAPQPSTTPSAWSRLYRQDIAEVLLDARDLLRPEEDPAYLDPASASDRARNPALIAAVCVASAHAAHSLWCLSEGAVADVGPGAQVLERARVVRAHLTRHPSDRARMRAAAPHLVSGEPAWRRAGTLALARAGLFTAREVGGSRSALVDAFDERQVTAIEAVLAEVMNLADGDEPGLLAAAGRLHDLLGRAHAGAAIPGLAEAEHSSDGILEEVAADARRARPSRQATSTALSERDVEHSLRAHARAAYRATFDATAAGDPPRRRTPDPVLRSQARALADGLRRARYRAPDLTSVASASPPGVLRLPEAMRREAQRDAGAEVTALPWLQHRRRDVAQPPLRVGLSWDVSRSRSDLHPEMADLAWALAWALAHVSGELAAVAWSSRALPVAWPGRVPAEVVEPSCGGGSSACPQSLRALDGALDLRERSGPRVVVVTTDGRIANRRSVLDEVRTLVEHGVVVLWVTHQPDAGTPRGAENVVLSDPASLVATVGRAICRSLELAST